MSTRSKKRRRGPVILPFAPAVRERQRRALLRRLAGMRNVAAVLFPDGRGRLRVVPLPE